MSCYVINDQCLFNDNTKELRDINHNTSIKLTSMRARCLHYIIQHADQEVIEKEELSQALWGSRSQFASDASLTQTLYLIRKDLKSMGVDELFITIPRHGIKVNNDLSVQQITENKIKPKYLDWKSACLACAILLAISLLTLFDITVLM